MHDYKKAGESINEAIRKFPDNLYNNKLYDEYINLTRTQVLQDKDNEEKNKLVIKDTLDFLKETAGKSKHLEIEGRYVSFLLEYGTDKEKEEVTNCFLEKHKEKYRQHEKQTVSTYENIALSLAAHYNNYEDKKEGLEKTVKLFEDLREAAGELFILWHPLIHVYEMTGRYGKGIETCKEAIENQKKHDPEDPEVNIESLERQTLYLTLLKNNSTTWTMPDKNGNQYDRTIFRKNGNDYLWIIRWVPSAGNDNLKKSTSVILDHHLVWGGTGRVKTLNISDLPESLRP